MEREIELLNFIYQNTKMAIISIEQLVDLNNEKKFNKLLRKQLLTYKCIEEQTILFLNERDMYEVDISTFSKIRTYLTINIQTILDKSSSHLASMLILGSTMGVIDIIKNINKYKDVNKEVVNLIFELKEYEEENIEKYKEYL